MRITRQVFAGAACVSLLAISLAGCTEKPVRVVRGLPHPSVSPVKAITDMVPIPWCLSQYGDSTVYPCKWDSRERYTIGWDRDTLPVALYVRRELGCPLPLPKQVSCFWAPQDRAPGGEGNDGQ